MDEKKMSDAGQAIGILGIIAIYGTLGLIGLGLLLAIMRSLASAF